MLIISDDEGDTRELCHNRDARLELIMDYGGTGVALSRQFALR